MVNTLELEIGETGRIVTGPFSTFVSHGSSIYKYNSDGTITATEEGTVDITVYFPDGVKVTSENGTNVCTVTITYPKRENTTLIDSGNNASCYHELRWELYESGNFYIYFRHRSYFDLKYNSVSDVPDGQAIYMYVHLK